MALIDAELSRRGWLTIACATAGVAVSVIPVSILSLGVFMKPLGAEFGWGRGEVAFALTLLSLTMALSLPLAGRVLDQFGVKGPLAISLVLYGGGIAILPLLIDRFGLAGLYAWAAWAGVSGSASSAIAYVKVLSGWFDRARGLALGFAMSRVAIGGAITPPLAASMIAASDWRAGFHVLALLPLFVGLPVAFMLQERPSAAAAQHNEHGKGGATFAQAIASSTFWLLFALFLLVAAAIHGVQIHLAPMLSDRGLEPAEAALGMTFMFLVSFVVRLMAGLLFDRVFAPWVGAACYVGTAIGCMMLVPEGGAAIYIGAVILLGVGAGAESDLLAYLVSRYFGLRAFGVIYGWLFGAFMIGSAIGPLAIGIAHDHQGSYEFSLQLSAAAVIVGVILLLMLPKFPTTTNADPTIAR